MDCEEIEGKDGVREKRGEEEIQIKAVLKQIYKINHLFFLTA